MPTMMTGSAATFIDCDDCWKLFLVTRKGYLYLWDLSYQTCILHDSLASLIASSPNSSEKDAGVLFKLNHVCVDKVINDGVQTCAYLESLLAFSFALGSSHEYLQCLLPMYAFLQDESQLREVYESFLGPPTGMAEEASSDSNNIAWDPFVLGMKKHKLREDIFSAMASNRKVQRLLNEFGDLLSECDIAGSNQD